MPGQDNFMLVIFLSILSAAFFLRWGLYEQDEEILPFYLLRVLPWSCNNEPLIYPRMYFILAEMSFALAAGAGIVGIMNDVKVLISQSVLFLLGLAFREAVKKGLVADGYGTDFLNKVFNPWWMGG